MEIVSWIIAIAVAVIAWKFLKGLIKVVFFVAAVIIIAWQIYPYVANLLSELL